MNDLGVTHVNNEIIKEMFRVSPLVRSLINGRLINPILNYEQVLDLSLEDKEYLHFYIKRKLSFLDISFENRTKYMQEWFKSLKVNYSEINENIFYIYNATMIYIEEIHNKFAQ